MDLKVREPVAVAWLDEDQDTDQKENSYSGRTRYCQELRRASVGTWNGFRFVSDRSCTLECISSRYSSAAYQSNLANGFIFAQKQLVNNPK